jgi:hypothetical protein
MAEWLKDHGADIGSLNLKFGLMDGSWLNWRPGETLRWKGEITGWEGREVVCRKPAPPKL